MRGVGKQATVRIWFRPVAIDVSLIFNVAGIFEVFPFPVSKAQIIGAISMKIGEAYRTQSSSL
jgi:hypothetical protein